MQLRLTIEDDVDRISSTLVSFNAVFVQPIPNTTKHYNRKSSFSITQFFDDDKNLLNQFKEFV